jgi:hypothetical protein
MTGPRVVVRLVLGDPKEEWVRRQMCKLADELERGEESAAMRKQLAKALRGIAAGVPAEKIFGLAKRRGGQSKARLHKWIAIDRELRRRLGHTKPDASVAADWNVRKVRTVEAVAQNHRAAASAIVDRWQQADVGLEPYLEAVAVARAELLTGKRPPITIRRGEKIELVHELADALAPPVELSRNESGDSLSSDSPGAVVDAHIDKQTAEQMRSRHAEPNPKAEPQRRAPKPASRRARSAPALQSRRGVRSAG